MADDVFAEPDDEPRGESVGLDEDTVEVEDTEDGGAVIRLGRERELQQSAAHFANIVEEVDSGELNFAVTDLLDKIERDKDARSKRDRLYEEGLRRTGLGDDAPGGAQFSGANKVVHPMLVEACVDFSARFMKEVFPPSGPVKSKVLGEAEPEKLEKARRKADFMNWQTTEQMVELRGELEQLSTQLPLGGGQYLKLMWSPIWRRPVAEFVPIDDIYLPFAATNFYSAERRTHVQYVSRAEFARRVRAGMYAEVNLGASDQVEYSRASQANDKIEGREDNYYNEDGLRTVFEVYTHLDLDGDGPAPYILSIDKASRRALALYRNWEPEDERRRELEWIVEFPFVPWRGAYPIGLTHMIGGLSGAATGALRALLDSAHIQNVPTLLKLKGGPGGQTINVQPTEVVEMEGGALVDDIRKLAMSLPFNGPSPTLFQLLGFLVDAGKGVVQTSFEKLADGNPNAPVGTTLALIEQGMVVFSSIHSRLHSAMGRVFKILHRINSANLTEEDIAASESGLEVEPGDFDGPLDVVPVSDPAIFSEAQRFAQVQAVQARAGAMPQMYDLRKVEEMFLRNLKLSPDDVLQPVPGKEDLDPASENVSAAMGRPVYVLPQQDHVAHLKTHLAFLSSPVFGSNPAIVKNYLYPMAQHLRDHLLNFYLTQTHEAARRAERENLVDSEDGQQQADLIIRVQKVIEQEFQGFAAQLAQIDQAAQQYAPKPQLPPDNSLQVAQINAQSKAADLQQRAQRDAANQQLESQRLQQDAQNNALELQLRQQEQAQRQQEAVLQAQLALNLESVRQGSENERSAAEIEARIDMNTADNQTAMHLAAAEIASGEKVAVSTGTGVNPGPR